MNQTLAEYVLPTTPQSVGAQVAHREKTKQQGLTMLLVYGHEKSNLYLWLRLDNI